MSGLSDFLLARFAEDEAVARVDRVDWVTPYDEPLRWSITEDGSPDMLAVDPARVLAECEAKRRIVERRMAYGREGMGDFRDGYTVALDDAIADLALPYADHPDYDESWRP